MVFTKPLELFLAGFVCPIVHSNKIAIYCAWTLKLSLELLSKIEQCFSFDMNVKSKVASQSQHSNIHLIDGRGEGDINCMSKLNKQEK